MMEGKSSASSEEVGVRVCDCCIVGLETRLTHEHRLVELFNQIADRFRTIGPLQCYADKALIPSLLHGVLLLLSWSRIEINGFVTWDSRTYPDLLTAAGL